MTADPRYPAGRFQRPEQVTDAVLAAWIEEIAACPAALRKAVDGLTDAQLDTPYREGGWTVRQVVHHLPDSHMNSYIRFKLALTEEEPTIKPYAEAEWANLVDAIGAPVEPSLRILEGLHDRWVRLLQAMSPADFQRNFIHPENGRLNLAITTGLYAWHCRHHLAHITSLRERMGW